MPVTFTIKEVPDELADRLRQRAAAERRSLQKELLVILEGAVPADTAAGLKSPPQSGRLSLEEVWERARRLGTASPPQSTDLIRRDRDARYHHR